MVGFPRWKIFFIVVVVFLGIWFALPNFVSASFLPHKKLNLGLDLRGGSQLLLEIDYDKYQKEQLAYIVEQLRKNLRSEKIGYKNLGVEGNFAVFNIRDPEQTNQAKAVIIDKLPTVTATVQGDKFQVGFSDRTVTEQKASLMQQSIEIIRRRIDETGTKEPIIQSQGNNRILLQVAGAENPEEIKSKINTTAKLNFYMVKGYSPVPKDKVADEGDMIIPDYFKENTYWEVEKQPLLGGENLVNATQTFDAYNHAAVSFALDNRGGKIFGDVTRDNVGKLFASVLDGKVISAPHIQEPIMGGSGQITGSFTAEEATKLATLLRAGALPASLKILEERTVGASLGQDSINAGTRASYIATLLVALFMIGSYGFFGLISVFALVINLILILAGMSLIQSTMTLPGIAGIALTTGISVDANVLIFERIREEIRNGKKPFACVEQGFDRAFATITDANVATITCSVLLYIFGTGTVKGFAVSLSIGIIASMFTAVMLSRFLITLWLNVARPQAIKL